MVDDSSEALAVGATFGIKGGDQGNPGTTRQDLFVQGWVHDEEGPELRGREGVYALQFALLYGMQAQSGQVLKQ
jgi:hypothetical protein